MKVQCPGVRTENDQIDILSVRRTKAPLFSLFCAKNYLLGADLVSDYESKKHFPVLTPPSDIDILPHDPVERGETLNLHRSGFGPLKEAGSIPSILYRGEC